MGNKGDYPHLYKDFHQSFKGGDSLLGEKTWINNTGNIREIHENPSWKQYEVKRVSLDDLLSWNNLNDEQKMQKHGWSGSPTSYKYNPNKDVTRGDIIHGVRNANGEIILNNGRHRAMALKNGGFTHVAIPVLEDRIYSLNSGDKPIDDAIKNDYENGNEQSLQALIRQLDADFLPYSKKQRQLLKTLLKHRIAYINEYNKYRR